MKATQRTKRSKKQRQNKCGDVDMAIVASLGRAFKAYEETRDNFALPPNLAVFVADYLLEKAK